jgi:hypothetical protein
LWQIFYCVCIIQCMLFNQKTFWESLCIKYVNTTFMQCNFTHWSEAAYYGKQFANREDILIAFGHQVVQISTSQWCQWCPLPLPSLIMNHRQAQGYFEC